MLRDLLATLGPQVADDQHPLGAGFLIHGGSVLKCAGKMGPNPDLTIDPTVEPEILIQHVIGVFSGGLDDVYPIPHPDMPDSNPEVNDSVFTLDPAQSELDPTNPVCCVCGSAINLKQ